MMIVALALLVFGTLLVVFGNTVLTVPLSGQPYAFRQAGLTMAVVLLVALTITVCTPLQCDSCGLLVYLPSKLG